MVQIDGSHSLQDVTANFHILVPQHACYKIISFIYDKSVTTQNFGMFELLV